MPAEHIDVVAGPATGTRVALGEEAFEIGRALSGEATLGDDPELSRRHARFSRVAGRILVEDLGSTNGTFVNGHRIAAPTVLEPGDTVLVGTSTLMVATANRPAPPPAPAPDAPAAAPAAPLPPAESGVLSRLAGLSQRHPKRVLALVGVFFLIALGVGGSVADVVAENETGFEDPDTEAVETEDRIGKASGELAGAQSIVVVRGSQPADSAPTRARVERLEDQIKRERLVTRTLTFYSTGSRSFVSKDGRSTFIAAFMKNVEEPEAEKAAVRIQERVENEPEVVVGGGALAGKQTGDRVGEDLGKAEGLAIPILFIVSLFVFRGFVAALLPLFVGILTIFGTFFVLRLVNEAVPISQFALNIVIGLGLGLAIDYSLFIVSRYREELARLGDVPDATSQALRRTLQSAGRTILFSSVTVAIALASLITFPQGFLYSMGIGGAVCALVAVAISLIALPALLAVLGPRVNAGAPARRRRSAERNATVNREGAWYRLAQAVMRRPGPVAAASAIFLILLGLPVLGLKFTGFDTSTVPTDLSAYKVDKSLREDFGLNFNEITVLAEAPASERAGVERLAAELRRLPGASRDEAQPPRPLRGGLWEIPVVPVGKTLDDRTIDLVEEIRDRSSPYELSVTGQTAQFIDRRASIGSHLPLALIILCGTTLIVLFLMTGSVILPIKSLLMNFLSLSAAFGLLVLIFQEGNLEGFLAYKSQGALELTQPVLLFALVFGVATDYAVFLLTRIKEARAAGASDREAVAIGLERTGRIVTQAAVLFCIAIGAFATSSVIFIKQVGLGTAFGVIIDATIIRAFLVPSLMVLLGSRNWWAPEPLKRLHARIGLREA